jgi:uncharacterized membrane protein
MTGFDSMQPAHMPAVRKESLVVRTKITPSTKSGDAGWERWVAVLLFLAMIPAPSIGILPIPTALLLAGICYLILRRRRIIAYHAMQVVYWQAVYLAVMVCIGILMLLTHTTNALLQFRNAVAAYTSSDLWATIPIIWRQASFGEHTVLLIALLLIVVNLTVSLWGAIATLCGRTFSVPGVGRLADRIYPRPS